MVPTNGGVYKHRLFFWWTESASFIVGLCGWGSKFGHGLCSFRDGVLRKLSRKEEADSCLDFSWWEGRFLVVSWQLGSFSSESVEDVVDEGVQDGHASLWDACAWVNLLQHSVDVSGVGLDSLCSSLATSACRLLWDLCRFLAACCWWCLCHCWIAFWLMSKLWR